jgi:hypothetical protein
MNIVMCVHSKHAIADMHLSIIFTINSHHGGLAELLRLKRFFDLTDEILLKRRREVIIIELMKRDCSVLKDSACDAEFNFCSAVLTFDFLSHSFFKLSCI